MHCALVCSGCTGGVGIGTGLASIAVRCRITSYPIHLRQSACLHLSPSPDSYYRAIEIAVAWTRSGMPCVCRVARRALCRPPGTLLTDSALCPPTRHTQGMPLRELVSLERNRQVCYNRVHKNHILNNRQHISALLMQQAMCSMRISS